MVKGTGIDDFGEERNAARSSPRGGGGAPSGWASLWECRAALSRQARPEEPQELSWGAAKAGTLTKLEDEGAQDLEGHEERHSVRAAAVADCWVAAALGRYHAVVHHPRPAVAGEALAGQQGGVAVTASITYGCSLCHIRLQAGHLEEQQEGVAEGDEVARSGDVVLELNVREELHAEHGEHEHEQHEQRAHLSP